MGASFSWYAVRGKTPEAIWRHFGLRAVREGENGDTPFCGAQLPTGWYLLIHGRHEFTDEEAELLSCEAEVIACFVEEHVMVSSVGHWKDGEFVWAVTHDAEQGDDHLEAEGELPAAFGPIRDRLKKQQEEEGGADYIFNIPVDLAKEITGYSHEEEPDITFENFVKTNFFQRLLGR